MDLKDEITLWESQFASSWLQMRNVAWSSMRATPRRSATFEHPDALVDPTHNAAELDWTLSSGSSRTVWRPRRGPERDAYEFLDDKCGRARSSVCLAATSTR